MWHSQWKHLLTNAQKSDYHFEAARHPKTNCKRFFHQPSLLLTTHTSVLAVIQKKYLTGFEALLTVPRKLLSPVCKELEKLARIWNIISSLKICKNGPSCLCLRVVSWLFLSVFQRRQVCASATFNNISTTLGHSSNHHSGWYDQRD